MPHHCKVRTNYKLDLTFTTKRTGFPGASGKEPSCQSRKRKSLGWGRSPGGGHSTHTPNKQHMCVHTQLFSSCPALCDHMDYNSPGSSVHGLLQARILERVVMLSSKGSSLLRDQTHVSCASCISGGFFTH